MSINEERTTEVAERLESELGVKDEARRHTEQDTRNSLNQGYEDPGAYDTKHPRITCGPSFRIPRKPANRQELVWQWRKGANGRELVWQWRRAEFDRLSDLPGARLTAQSAEPAGTALSVRG